MPIVRHRTAPTCLRLRRCTTALYLLVGQPDLGERDADVLRSLGVHERDLSVGSFLAFELRLDPRLLLHATLRLRLAELVHRTHEGRVVCVYKDRTIAGFQKNNTQGGGGASIARVIHRSGGTRRRNGEGAGTYTSESKTFDAKLFSTRHVSDRKSRYVDWLVK